MSKIPQYCLALWISITPAAYSQLIEQPARVREISYDNHSQIVPIAGARVRVETEERSDKQGFVTIKITPNIDGTFQFHDIRKVGYTLISPTEEELQTRKFALNSRTRQEIVMVSKIKLHKEKKRIASTRKKYLENKIKLMREQVANMPESAARKDLQEELDELLSNYDKILTYIDREAERLSRIDCMTLTDMELKNLNFKKEGKADELIAYNLSLLPENEEEQARALINAIRQGEIQLEKIAQLQTHWGLIYKQIALGHLLRHSREESNKWWQLRTQLAPQCVEYRFDYAHFLEVYTTDYKMALDEYKKCLALLSHEEKHLQLRLKIYQHIGIVYSRMGDFSLALESYSRALDLLNHIKDEQGRAKADLFTCIALTEGLRSNFLRAIQYLSDAQGLFEAHWGKSHIETAQCYLALAYNYAQARKLAEAQQYLKLAKPLIDQTYGNDHLIMSDCLECEGIIEMLSNQPQQAKKAFDAAMSIRSRVLGKQHPSTQLISQRIDKLRTAQASP